jgi:hypothetical protein
MAYKWFEQLELNCQVLRRKVLKKTKAVMSAFPQLSNGDIDNIIAYTSEPKLKPCATSWWY